MGSALCFPIESIVFFVLLKAQIIELFGRCNADDVYVYGDDIIIKSEFIPALDILTQCGLIINTEKSFTTGFFRESCGADWYRGHDVTPLRMRIAGAKPSEATKIGGLTDFSNALFEHAYYHASKTVGDYVEWLLRSRLPYTNSKVGYLSWVRPRFSIPFSLKGKRWNANLKRYELKVLTIVSRTELFMQGLYREAGELFRKITQGWSDEYSSFRYNLKNRETIRRKWVSVDSIHGLPQCY
jgi:hypothetical protein